MLRKMFRGLAFGIGAAALIGLSLLPASAASGGAAGAVYALTNSPAGNAVVVYQRGADGSLTPDGLFATGGLGTGSSLGSQGAVIVSDDGKAVIVAEKATNRIDVYVVGADGLLSGPTVFPSAGPTPFGFAVDKRNTLLVSEAGAGGGASSYRIGANGSLTPVSSMVMTGQRAACWAAVTKNGRYGYVTNAGTGNISGFAIAQDGSASLLNADGVTAATGGNPQDMALSLDSSYLYARVPVTGVIAIFRIRSDGSLDPLPSLAGTHRGLPDLAA